MCEETCTCRINPLSAHVRFLIFTDDVIDEDARWVARMMDIAALSA